MTEMLWSREKIAARLDEDAEKFLSYSNAYDAMCEILDAFLADRAASMADIAELVAQVGKLTTQTLVQAATIGIRDATIHDLRVQIASLQADVTATIGASGVVSRTVPAVSFVENPPVWTTAAWPATKASLAQIGTAYKTHIQPFGLQPPWKSDATGKLEAKPSLWNTGNRLGAQLQKFHEIDPAAPIILTLYGAEWFMMELVAPDGSRTPKTYANRFDDSGRVAFAQLPDWLIEVDGAVALAAGFGCRDFEIWNECKGYYNNPWDMGMVGEAGKPMGYTYFYRATAAQIEATMTRLGIARADYRIAAPYAVYATRGDKTADALPDTHPLSVNAAKYGYIQKQAVNATTDFFRNARDNHLTVNAIALDASTYLKSGTYPSTNPFDYIQKFEDLCVWAESVLVTYGFDANMDKFYSELYPTPDPTHQTADSEQLRAALWAETLRICVLHGVRFPIMWGPTSPAGGFYHELGALVDANGALQATGRVFKLFKDNFSTGVRVYPLTGSDARVGGLATDAVTVLWNRTAAPLTVAIDDKVVTLAAYEVREVA